MAKQKIRIRLKAYDHRVLDQSVVCANFKMLVRIFINKSRASYCKPFYPSWQGYWTNNSGTSSLGGLDNPLGRLVEHTMIKCFEADTNFLLGHHITPTR